MAITINSNLASLRLVREVSRTSAEQARSFERLASGLRINRASDDATGLAIATSLGTDTRIFGRARLNIADGVSALSTALGATSEISTLLQRMGELAEQAANGTLSLSQRRKLDQEYQQLDREIRRIAETTSFNGRSLLSGVQKDRTATLLNSGGDTSILSDFSGDGRYFAYGDVASTNLRLYDRTTGTTKILGNFDIGSVEMSNSGDFVFNDGGRLLRYDIESGQMTELISSNLVGGFGLSADGRTLAFSSTINYSTSSIGGGGVVDGGNYLYTLDLESNQLRKIASGGNGVSNQFSSVDLSADGTKATFLTAGNVNGLNPTGNGQRFVADISPQTPVIRRLEPLVTGIGFPLARILNNGDVFYTSSYDLNGAAMGQTALFRYSFAANSATKLVSNVVSADFGVTLDGSQVTFASSANLVGTNPSNEFQVFRYDVGTRQIRQLTTKLTFDDVDNASLISADGNSLLRVSSGFQLYLDDISLGADTMAMEVGHGAGKTIDVTFAALGGALKGLGSYTLTSARSARSALGSIRNNIDRLTQLSGELGVGVNRLEVANSVLNSQILSGEAARSQIQDVDVASEAANLTRNAMLQRAATALLAQANQQPALALKLLGRG